jgi:hypothetical protein
VFKTIHAFKVNVYEFLCINIKFFHLKMFHSALLKSTSNQFSKNVTILTTVHILAKKTIGPLVYSPEKRKTESFRFFSTQCTLLRESLIMSESRHATSRGKDLFLFSPADIVKRNNYTYVREIAFSYMTFVRISY